MHPNCHYEWICIEKRDHSYPDTPVLYVNEPNLYKCSVATKKKKVFDITFDVSYVPAGLLSIFFFTKSIKFYSLKDVLGHEGN